MRNFTSGTMTGPDSGREQHFPISEQASPLAPDLLDAISNPLAGFSVAQAWGLSDAECARALGYTDLVPWFWRYRVPVGIDAENVARGTLLVGVHRLLHDFTAEPVETLVRRTMQLPGAPGRSIAEIVATGEITLLQYLYGYFRDAGG